MHRAVVLLQLDHLQLRVVGLQVAQVLHVGAAPRVDRLIVVADRGEGAAAAGQQLHDLVLAAVGVLVLVDQQIAQPALPARQQFLVGGEQLRRNADEIVEVDRPHQLELPLVTLISNRRQMLGIGLTCNLCLCGRQ